MPANQLNIGVQNQADGAQMVIARAGRQGDQIVSELHGRFYEQAYRGNLFSNGVTALTALTAEELAAYEALVQKYGSYVYNIAYRMCGSEADAKDLAQEAFIRVFRAFRRIDPEASLEAWLYRIVRNLHIDLIRRLIAAESA